MTRLPYSHMEQSAELLLRSGRPENTPATNAFRMFAHAPAVGAATLRLVFALLTETALDPCLRELVILRISQRCDCYYAWTQHVAIACGAGVQEAQIAALEQGEAPPSLFDQRARAVFALADDILKNCRASDCTFTVTRNLFSRREIVELLLLIGYFRMISGVMTTLDVEVESPSHGNTGIP